MTIPNFITLGRVILVPVIFYLLVSNETKAAFFVFVLAGISDAVDGYLAKSFGWETELGAYLDPMADKLLLLTTFVVLSLPGIGLTNRLPLWLTVLIISRDIVIVLTVAVITLALGPRSFAPSIYGKAATATYIVTSIVVMLFNYRQQTSVLVDVGIYASLVMTLVSGVHYVVHVRRIINQPPASS